MHRKLLPLAAADLALVILLASAFAATFVLEGYRLFQLSSAMAYAIALLGLHVLIGLSGQLSLGHGAFMALGAYSAALLMLGLGLPYWAALPVTALICFVVGLVLGLPALRFSGHYLALCTFVLAIAVPQLLKAKSFDAVTGGVGGLILTKPSAPAWLPADPDQWLYLVSLLLLAVCYVLVRNVSAGASGRALRALRDHPSAAACMGINVSRYKTVAFGAAAALAGIGGALSALLVQFVAPDSFSIMLSISLLVGIVLGGLGVPAGALAGAVFVQYVPELADSLSKSAPSALYGVLVIAAALLFPQGLAGSLHLLMRWRPAKPPRITPTLTAQHQKENHAVH